ncbi:MAG: type II toxin-antitoxin system VapC family toxin [Acidobacteriia bacterium]|nr:type II toxin-antitoxin system VapC family toxin [Terriglobia bacterium]
MVLDTSALVSIHIEEPGSQMLFRKIDEAPHVVIGAPILFEAAMVLSGRTGTDARFSLSRGLRRLGVEIVPFTEDHYEAAVTAFLRYGKGRHPAGLNFGDCMSYGLARVSGLPLLYTGNDFSLTDITAA